jgi:hypothetical protein
MKQIKVEPVAALVVTALMLCSVQAWAQQAVPPSTNPAQRVVFPADSQTSEQQMADQLACYNWATQQTQWDPHQAYVKLEQEHSQALAQYQSTQGSAVRGAARGALAGLAIGAIAGDAGKGAAIGAVAGGAARGIRGRRTRRATEASFEQAVEQFKEEFRLWDRHWVGCMQGKNYTVN